jgi:hypothetical protein
MTNLDGSQEPPPRASIRRFLGTFNPPRTRTGRSFPWGVMRLAIGVIAAVGLITAAQNMGPAVRAATHDGPRGTWVAAYQACSNGHCSWRGTFVPADGKRLTDLSYSGHLHNVRIGTTMPARYTGGNTVYPLGGSALWIFYSLGIVLCGLVLLWLGRGFIKRHFRRPVAADIPEYR